MRTCWLEYVRVGKSVDNDDDDGDDDDDDVDNDSEGAYD